MADNQQISVDDTFKLITLRMTMQPVFKHGARQWSELAERLSAETGTAYTAYRCRTRFQRLQRTYRKLVTQGRTPGLQFPWFSAMRAFAIVEEQSVNHSEDSGSGAAVADPRDPDSDEDAAAVARVPFGDLDDAGAAGASASSSSAPRRSDYTPMPPPSSSSAPLRLDYTSMPPPPPFTVADHPEPNNSGYFIADDLTCDIVPDAAFKQICDRPRR